MIETFLSIIGILFTVIFGLAFVWLIRGAIILLAAMFLIFYFGNDMNGFAFIGLTIIIVVPAAILSVWIDDITEDWFKKPNGIK